MNPKKVEIVSIDTNVVLRFLVKGDSSLNESAEKIFLQAEAGELRLYLDEVILAEVIWVLTSFYKMKKEDIGKSLSKLLTCKWILNQRKELMTLAVSMYTKTKLHYPDCWLYVVTNNLGHGLRTFDLDLMKMAREK